MKEMSKRVLLLLVWVAWSLSSCTEGRLYENFYAFEDKIWAETDTAKFDISGLKTKAGKSLIAVKYSENYPFSNCYIRVIERDSSKSEVQSRLLNVPIFQSKSGQPLGEGFGNTFTKYDTLPFQLSDKTREVVLVQYMRQAELNGIEAVGLKIVAR